MLFPLLLLLLLCTLCALKLEDEAPNLLVFNEIKEEPIVLEGPSRRTTTKVLDVIPAVAARTQPISSCLLVSERRSQNTRRLLSELRRLARTLLMDTTAAVVLVVYVGTKLRC